MVRVPAGPILALSLIVPLPTLAAESPPELTAAAEEPLDLGDIEVSGQRLDLTPEQEATLRLVRMGLSRSKSSRQEDKDEIVCWFEERTGTGFTYLACARNGDLWALSEEARGALGRMRGDNASSLAAGDAGYGKIMRTQRPVNRYVIERTMDLLPGGPGFDAEFVMRAAQGRAAPRDIPSDEELVRFASAHQELERIQHRSRTPTASGRYARRLEQRMVTVLESHELSVDRYNRIVDLLDIYESLRRRFDELRRTQG